jgi:ribosomal protein S18 acetylase RimI-like enzyme
VAEKTIDFYQDEFDSRMLGRSVYKLWVRQEVTHPIELEGLYAGKPVDVVFCFTAFSASNIAAMQKLSFKLVSIRNTYDLSIDSNGDANANSPGMQIPDDVVLLRSSQGIPHLHPADMTCLAEVIGATSRYFKDADIPRDLSLRLYETWLDNSLNRGYADEVILAMKGEALIGIHTLRIRNGVGNVDLIGVHPSYQGGGLGRALLQEGIRFFRERQLRAVHVVTEGENVSASRFYQRNGFLLRSIELVWHKHVNRCIGS